MISIIVDNSISRIEGLSIAQEKSLRNLLSYVVDDYNSRFGPQRKYLISKRGEFATGLLPRVYKWLQSFSYRVYDLRVVPSPLQGVFNLSLGVGYRKSDKIDPGGV